ncbi:hypothetical protein [Veillonella caviae]|uniref:hypothetical protein n=1 Tax=Veillonella caviae TaxID=248316 RepID=UPI002A91F1A1|nr:hypothetical protein [Veillonella caviae]MDY5253858.1 hypothetical protein [Veillonella caviae]
MPEWYSPSRVFKWIHENFASLGFPLGSDYKIVESHSSNHNPAIYWLSRGIQPKVDEFDQYTVADYPISKNNIPLHLEMRARYIYNGEHSGDLNLHESARSRDLENATQQVNQILRKNNIVNEHDPLATVFRYKDLQNMTVYDIKNIANKELPSSWGPVEIFKGRIHIKQPIPQSLEGQKVKPQIRLRVDPAGSAPQTPYEHLHLYSKDGKPLDINWKPVDRKSSDAHIEIKEAKK